MDSNKESMVRVLVDVEIFGRMKATTLWLQNRCYHWSKLGNGSRGFKKQVYRFCLCTITGKGCVILLFVLGFKFLLG